ncbi:hypothetical protein ACJRO7_023831 [Eucalyptus globulus]|uniref:Uncharacterized protein n=1 Tax=Eucalyptus globulus TaxID=34317 RepID=A0ABD3K959_EUCGL
MDTATTAPSHNRYPFFFFLFFIYLDFVPQVLKIFKIDLVRIRITCRNSEFTSFSSDAKKDIVVMGVNSRACNFLVKPIQISTLNILWQHVLRSNRSSSNNCTKELERQYRGKWPRVAWTFKLNQMSIMAVNHAKPKKILQIIRKMTGCTLAQYPSQAMNFAPQQQCTGRSMRMPDLVKFPGHNALPRYQMGLQSQLLMMFQQPNSPFQNYSRQQQVNESAQCLPYAPAPSVGFAPLMNDAPNTILPPRLTLSHCIIQSLNSSTSHPASEQCRPIALSTIGAIANKSCSNSIFTVKGECYWKNCNPVAKAMLSDLLDLFADMLDMVKFPRDLGLGEDVLVLDSYIRDKGAM